MKLNLFFPYYPLIQFAITIHFESQAIDGLHLSSPVLPFNDISFIKKHIQVFCHLTPGSNREHQMILKGK